ncbi:phosphotransferase enzyme family protein [Paenibacillus tengchongensis]|uniref:phosphotransferase enzyme family protein n=1 Tax=Paenibacillus tengchongensis TaxID=2608684 RepID=UPI0016529B0F|nr:phosphotransferase [Paenibacillus tengchongensis]
MTKVIEQNHLLAWVQNQWSLPAIVEAEAVSGSSGQVLRLTCGDGRVVYLKQTDSAERMQRITAIQEVLQQHGVRVAVALPAAGGERWVTFERQLYTLTNELKGAIISELKPEIAAVYGQGLAKLHEGLRHMAIDHYPVMDFTEQLMGWAIPHCRAAGDSLGCLEELEAVLEEMVTAGIPRLAQLPQQLIHRDTHPGNMVLMDDGGVGFLDFEISVAGLRIFDLGYLCTSQWISAYQDEQKRQDWLRLVEEILRGYERAGRLPEAERDCLFYTMCGIQMIFTAYWQGEGRADQAAINLEALLALMRVRACLLQTLILKFNNSQADRTD